MVWSSKAVEETSRSQRLAVEALISVREALSMMMVEGSREAVEIHSIDRDMTVPMVVRHEPQWLRDFPVQMENPFAVAGLRRDPGPQSEDGHDKPSTVRGLGPKNGPDGSTQTHSAASLILPLTTC